MSWSKSIIHWREGEQVFVSVPFTWYLPLAKKLCAWNKQAGLYVHAGGPAVDLMPEYLYDVADETGGEMYPLPLGRHNPDATFTTRGCIRRCRFCAVPKIEGEFRELSDWIPAPIVCDNNLLASSRRHFDSVVDHLKGFRGVDFNQGLDARLLNNHHIERLQELRLPKLRFAFDHISVESTVMDAIDRVLKAGFAHRRIGCYVLFGFEDSPEDALYRAEAIKARGIKPFLQRYQLIEGDQALKKDSWVGPGWTGKEMHRFQRYWCRQNWLSKIPYSEFEG
jgi:hypothetical protein